MDTTPTPNTTDDYRPGDLWPDDVPGGESATPVLSCPCGGFVDIAGGSCEACGRTFDEHGRRLIDEEDLDEDGALVPMLLVPSE